MLIRFKNIGLLFLCIWNFLIKGKSNKFIKNPKKVLIIQRSKLGDMVCTTPMFRAVKEAYPSCKVIVVGNSLNKEVLKGNKDVDKYIVFSSLFEVLKEVKKEKVDFACTVSPDFINLVTLYLSGISSISAPTVRNGYSPYMTKSYLFLLNFVLVKAHRIGYYAPREYLRLLESINIFSDKTKKYLTFSRKAEEQVDNFLSLNNFNKEDFIVGVSVTAGNKIKEWSPDKFVDVITYIGEVCNKNVILIGNKEDESKVMKVYNLLKGKEKVINSAGLFKIDQLKALISKMDIFISVDTGPIYIAEVFGVATIDIVGPMDENEQPPRGERNKVVFLKDRKKPELHIMNARDYDNKEARRQVDGITVGMVKKEINNLILDLKKARRLFS